MGIDWDKSLRTKDTKQVICDIARWKNGDPAINPAYQTALCAFGAAEPGYIELERIENVPDTYWLASDSITPHGVRVGSLSDLSPAWSRDSTCIELEPVTNGPDRVVQTILLGDAE